MLFHQNPNGMIKIIPLFKKFAYKFSLNQSLKTASHEKGKVLGSQSNPHVQPYTGTLQAVRTAIMPAESS
jgi:hypothetical protein